MSMANRVDAAMQSVETPGAEARIDRILSQPQLNELSASYDPELLLCQTPDSGVDSLSLSFPAYRAGFCNLAWCVLHRVPTLPGLGAHVARRV